MTSGKLTVDDLDERGGKIISKRKSNQGKQRYKTNNPFKMEKKQEKEEKKQENDEKKPEGEVISGPVVVDASRPRKRRRRRRRPQPVKAGASRVV
jgi:hypothetical protein